MAGIGVDPLNRTASSPATDDLARKSGALLKLGDNLHSYDGLQAEYMSLIHMPDFHMFAEMWAKSLYRPVHDVIRGLLASDENTDPLTLLYCAPGPHVPLLSLTECNSFTQNFTLISLADIDRSNLLRAAMKVKHIASQAVVRTVRADFTGGLGQGLADVLRDSLKEPTTLQEIHEKLAAASSVVDDLFQPQRVRAASKKVRKELLLDGIGSLHTVVVSEMVASFTATAVWMAFRSALYSRFSDPRHRDTLERCVGAAAHIVQFYNARFLAFHLETLAGCTSEGGYLVMIFDTVKRYDDPAIPEQHAFPKHPSPQAVVQTFPFQIVSYRSLVWRDHPQSFPVKLQDIPIPDFQAHGHDVAVFALKKLAPANTIYEERDQVGY
ncbi:MAG: hypothetical protein WCD15_10625 [Terriglobales bacterium]